jgi:hypothetical protein
MKALLACSSTAAHGLPDRNRGHGRRHPTLTTVALKHTTLYQALHDEMNGLEEEHHDLRRIKIERDEATFRGWRLDHPVGCGA